jgi:hypothetical protein
MKTERKPFMPLDPEIVDDQLEQLAATKGVGKLEKPAQPSGEGEGVITAPRQVERAGTHASEKCKIHIEAPDYLGTALKIQAATTKTSVRHIILKALKDAGFEIRDADMFEDGRRGTRTATTA